MVAWKVPSVFPKRIETVTEPPLTTAKSQALSPLKWPTASDSGALPTGIGRSKGSRKEIPCAVARLPMAPKASKTAATLLGARKYSQRSPGELASMVELPLFVTVLFAPSSDKCKGLVVTDSWQLVT